MRRNMAGKVAGDSEPIDFSPDFIAMGKNSKTIVCELCKCKVLKPGIAELVEKEVYEHTGTLASFPDCSNCWSL